MQKPNGIRQILPVVVIVCFSAASVQAQLEPARSASDDRIEAALQELRSRIDSLETQNAELRSKIAPDVETAAFDHDETAEVTADEKSVDLSGSRLSFEELLARSLSAEQRLTSLEESARELAAADENAAEEAKKKAPKYIAHYSKGFVFEPIDKEKTPFELRVNGRMQFRYTGFKRESETFNTLAGPVPVEDRNDFEIERGRLEFSGFMLDPKLQYYINIDADTDDQHRAIFHDFWVNYKFDDAFNLFGGKAFVPGSRDWLAGSTRTHLADRSMANSFFRPDRSIGVWAEGEIADGVFYRAMLANGFNTQDLRPAPGLIAHEIDSQFAYAATSYWDPFGDYGKGYADIDCTCDLLARVGHSFTFAPNQGQDNLSGIRLEETSFRLSDGSLLTAPGVLGPGAQVRAFDAYLYAVDAAFKYRGWSMNSEFYFRWLEDLKANAPIITNELYDDGFYVDLGKMILPKKLEAVGRVSTVDGAFGDSWEYAGGFNIYLNGDHSHKLTLDAAVLDGSPIAASSPNYEIGQDGMLYRMQYQVAF